MTADLRLVSAGAGAGKTYWIVEHVVARVAAGIPLERVAVVTFTEAAAAELQDRLRARLQERGLHDAAARVESAAVCTIHRFALTLLQRYPLAAGLPAEPIVLDEQQSAALLEEHAGRVLRSGAKREGDGLSDAELRAVLELGLGPGMGLSARGFSENETPAGRFRSLLRAVLEKARSIGMHPERLETEAERAAERLCKALGPEGNAAALDGDFAKAFAQASAFLAKNPEAPTKTDQKLYSYLQAVLRGDEAKETVTLAMRLASMGEDSCSKKFVVGAELLRAAEHYVLKHPGVRQRLSLCVRGVLRAASHVMRAMQRDKARMGALDFEDMQTLALDLLEGKGVTGAAYAALAARCYRLVVVDEFQDTSPLQYRLFELLREHGSEVAYVGDLKQAIYGFRSADSALFAALLGYGAQDEGTQLDRLDRSRRSRPALVAFANDLFAALMDGGGCPFEPLEADNPYARGAAPREGACIDVLRHPLSERGPMKGARAHAVIERLREHIEGPKALVVLDRVTGKERKAQWGDVAILCRRNDPLARWAAELRLRGIASLAEQGSLFESTEVALAVAWLRMLASPLDAVASASVLVSELYGISQRTMATMRLESVLGAPARALELAQRNPEQWNLSREERVALARCAADLSEGRRALRELPLAEAVEFALEKASLALRLSVGKSPAEAARIFANVRCVSELAHAMASRTERALSLRGATGLTIENLLLELDRVRVEGRRQRAGDENPDAVRLCTIHGSKGLEYPIVVLDALDEPLSVRLPRVEVARPEDPSALLGPRLLEECGLRVVPETGAKALAEQLRYAFDGEREQREEWLRLLYVGVTRAREHLMLLWPEEGKTASTTRYVRDLFSSAVSAPPSTSGASGWVLRPGLQSHAVFVVAATAPPERAARAPSEFRVARETFAAEVRSIAPEPSLRDPFFEAPKRRASLAVVSPTELCLARECPEVPRLSLLYPKEHRLARNENEEFGEFSFAGAEEERKQLAEQWEPSELGTLFHAILEHAELLENDSPEVSLRVELHRRGMNDPLLERFLCKCVEGVRVALRTLGTTAIAGREVPFAVPLAGAVLQGSVDLVVRSAEGMHVIDLKAHVPPQENLGRWVAHYGPQLDSYAWALSRVTQEPIAGRHLLLPAAGRLLSVKRAFDPDVFAAQAAQWTAELAEEVAGPGAENDCAVCAWSKLCRVQRDE